MRERLMPILTIAGYIAFYLFAFFFAAYLTFPYERLRDRLVAEFAADQKGRPSNQRLEIDELEPYWFTGVRARGVKVTIAAPAKAAGESTAPTVIEVEELRARTGVFAKLLGKTKVNYFVKGFGGEISGTFVDSAAERRIEMDIDDIAVSRLDALVAAVGLPMAGSMKGEVNLVFPERRASKGEGQVKLTITDLSVGDGKAKIKNTIALPKMNVGELGFDAEVQSGVLKVNKLAASGGDLEIATDGKIQLRDIPLESVCDLYLRFKFSDAFKGRNETTRTIFGAPGSTAPALFELDPSIKSAKRSDGFYGWHMLGNLTTPKFDPFSGNPPGSAPIKAPTPAIAKPK